MSDTGWTDRERLERLIAASGDYVQPTEDLRPRVLELARDQSVGRREGCRLAAWTLAACLCVTVGGSIGGRFPAVAVGERDGIAFRGWGWRDTVPRGSAFGADSPESLGSPASYGGLERELTEVVGRWRSERVLGRSEHERTSPRIDGEW